MRKERKKRKKKRKKRRKRKLFKDKLKYENKQGNEARKLLMC